MTNLEKVGQNFGIHAGVHRIESTAFPSLESVGGSFLINATKSLEVLEIGCFRNMFHIGRDFTVFAESIRHFQLYGFANRRREFELKGNNEFTFTRWITELETRRLE